VVLKGLLLISRCAFNCLLEYCRNLNLGLANKARACRGVGQEGSSRVTSHVSDSVRECEGMNLHTPK
jgi:hypothetical protein